MVGKVRQGDLSVMIDCISHFSGLARSLVTCCILYGTRKGSLFEEVFVALPVVTDVVVPPSAVFEQNTCSWFTSEILLSAVRIFF